MDANKPDAFRQDYQVDILIPGWENVPLTRRCLASLAQTEGVTYQVTYIDNGSRPQEVQALLNDWPGIQIVRLPINHGFIRAINTGMALALFSKAPYVLWLNNDVEVPAGDPGWLKRLLEPFEDPTVAATGAVSNNVSAFQKRERDALVPDTWSEVPILIGFALALRKTAMQQVGFLDERFEPGNYEDWDYSLRLRDKGGRLIVVESVYLHHKMHQTFKRLAERSNIDFAALLETNLSKFIVKWTPEGLARFGIALQSQENETAPAVPAWPEVLPPQAVRLVTHTTANWLDKIQPYLSSLKAHSPWETWLLTVGFSLNGATPEGVHAVPAAVVPGAPEYSHSLQHGGFLPYVPGPDEDVLIYTDGDIRMQRPPTDDERSLIENIPEGMVLAGYNSGPYETLALEATRLSPRIPDLGTVFDPQIVATAGCYNLGVVAARRLTWERICRRYLELYPTALQVFAHPARQQWLVCYVIAELGLAVQVLPYTFHLHGCYALPEGGAVADGVAAFEGHPVLFRHRL